LKLWVINHYARTPDKAGLTRHFDIAKNLITRGIRTFIVKGSSDGYLGSSQINNNIRETQTMDVEGVSFTVIPTPSYRGNVSFGRIRNMWVFGRRLEKELKKPKYGKPDIIVGSTMSLFAANAAFKLAKYFDVPFIYEVRDLWPLTPIELGGYSKWHPFIMYLDYLDKKLAKCSDLIVTTAPLMKEYYKERFNIPEEKFLWITNGTYVEMFKEVAEAQRPKDKKTFDIFYTGAHGLANGLDRIFDQLSKIKIDYPQVRLVLVGDGHFKEHLMERATKEKLPVKFLDPVPKKELPKLLKDADALIFNLLLSKLFRYGISPNKLADYHAAGKPIIMIGEYANNPVKESRAGVVISNPEELPKALNKLLEMDEEALREMGKRGVEYAKKNYDWAILADRFHKGILNAIHNRKVLSTR